tara:strand:- start:6572 stop:9004 length:2433 start_codon:yes stop_codon:yes gene_type:complete
MPKRRRTLEEWKKFSNPTGSSIRNITALVKELQSRNYSDERIATVLFRQAQMAREVPTKRTFEVTGVRTKRKRPQYRFFNNKAYQLFGVAQNGADGKPSVNQLARTKQLADLIRSYGSNVRVVQWRDEIGLYVRDNLNWRRDPRINWNPNENQVQRMGGVQIFPRYRPNDTTMDEADVYTEVYPRSIPIDSLYQTGTDTPSLRDRQWQTIPLEPTIANQWQYPVIYNRMVDCRGLNCPYPVLRARQAMKEIEPGEEITLVTTDWESWHDIPLFVNRDGHELVYATKGEKGLEGQYTFKIKKGEPRTYDKKIFDDWEDALKADANLFEERNLTDRREKIEDNRAKRFDRTNANKERKMLLIHDMDGTIQNYGFLTRTEAAEVLFNIGIYPHTSRFDEKFREDQRRLKQLEKGYFGKANLRDAERLTREASNPSPRSEKLYSLIDVDDITIDAETFLEAIGVDISDALQNENLGTMLEPKELTNPERTARAYQAFVFALINEYGLDGDEVIDMIETQGITEKDLIDAFQPTSLFEDSEDFDSMIVGNPEEPTQREIEMIRKFGPLNFMESADFETLDNPLLRTIMPPPKDSPLYWNSEIISPPKSLSKGLSRPLDNNPSFVNKIDKQTLRDQRNIGISMVEGASAALALQRLEGGLDITDVQRLFERDMAYEKYIRLPSGEIGIITASDSFPEDEGESEYNENDFVEITGFSGDSKDPARITTLDVVSFPDWRQYFAGDFENLATWSPTRQRLLIEEYPQVSISDPITIAKWNRYLNNEGQDIKDELEQIGGDDQIWTQAFTEWIEANDIRS